MLASLSNVSTFLRRPSIVTCLASCAVLAVAYFTYFTNYHEPDKLFWDENYYLPPAQRYIDGVFFFESHPPLGKLLIAAGEYLLAPNNGLDVRYFYTTAHIKHVPAGYSFRGMRLLPALFGMLSAVLFFLILFLFSKKQILALLLSSLYLFENAIIVQSRGAMLDSFQVFFALLSLLYVVFLIQRRKPVYALHYGLIGVILGFAATVKLNGLILFLLYPFLFYSDQKQRYSSLRNCYRQISLQFFSKAILSIVLACAAIIFVWYLHFFFAKRVVDNQFYDLPEEYRHIVTAGKAATLKYFPTMMREGIRYGFRYHDRVPKLKGDVPDENGSHPVFWPLGKKSISYRWDKTADAKVKYLRLQCNPISWFIGSVAALLAVILVGSHFLYGLPVKNRNLFFLICMFTVLYLTYMVGMFNIDRVMYLYHYFFPHLCALLLAALIFQYIFEEELLSNDKYVYGGTAIFVGNIVAAYLFFSPFTYYDPLSSQEFLLRSWLDIWRLEPVNW